MFEALLFCAPETINPFVVRAITFTFDTERISSSASAESSPNEYSLQSLYLSPDCDIITSARLAKVLPLKTRAFLRGLSIAPPRILSLTEMVTSIVPVPDAGVTVTQSGASDTQSASA